MNPFLKTKGRSDLSLLFLPLEWTLQLIFRFLHWWLALLFLLYLGSGIRVIQPDEVALVYRFGALQGKGTAQAVKQSGLLFALPKPIDRVQRIATQKIIEQELRGLHFTSGQKEGQPLTFLSSSGINPEKVGYVLTGDGNVVHISLLLNYQIIDPVAFATEFESLENILPNIIQAATIREIGALEVDRVLSDGRQDLLKAITKRSQSELDRLGIGVKIISLEAKDLVPPYQVKDDFTAVQSADIEKQTTIQKAKEYQTAQIPKAETKRNKDLQQAKGYAHTLHSKATAEANVFEQLFLEAQQNPEVVWTRLHREGLEKGLENVGKLRFVPAPPAEYYQKGFRVNIEPLEKK